MLAAEGMNEVILGNMDATKRTETSRKAGSPAVKTSASPTPVAIRATTTCKRNVVTKTARTMLRSPRPRNSDMYFLVASGTPMEASSELMAANHMM